MYNKTSRRKQQKGYVASIAPVHAFRLAEKKYKLYKGVDTDLSDVIDLSKNTDAVDLVEGATFRGKPIYSLRGHPGFLVIPSAVKADEQLQWAIHIVAHYSSGRTNINSAPARGNEIVAVPPLSPEGLNRLQWATLGAHFEWTSRTYKASETSDAAFPSELSALCADAYSSIGLEYTEAKGVSATVNYYMPHRQMCGHIDDAEGDMTRPLVSLSIGHSCVYLLGGLTYDVTPTALMLHSGDLVMMTGDSRSMVHGVPRIMENSIPQELRNSLRNLPDDVLPPAAREYAADVRLNVNVRTGVFEA